jgi:signal transduction histidine kinase
VNRLSPAVRFRSLPLFWKVLVPFLLLILLLGVLGSFVIVRDLTSNAQARLSQDLLRSSLEARSAIHDRELYLLESASFAANLQGMAEATGSNDDERISKLLQSVLALKTDLDLLVVANRIGIGLAEFRKGEAGQAGLSAGTEWAAQPFVGRVLDDPKGRRVAGFVNAGSHPLMAIAAPICSGSQDCAAVGVVIVAVNVDRLIANEASDTSAAAGAPEAGMVIYDEAGGELARAGIVPRYKPPTISGRSLIRRNETGGSTEISTLYAPLEIQGQRAGTVAVSLPTDPAFASVRGAGIRLALFLLAAMAGIVAIGAMLSRFIMAQVRPLLETSRALGRGDLSARAPVVADDELSELARDVNQMAEQLEASYETLELRVTERTEEVQRLLRERTDLFTALSHEFRTPLAVITRYLEMMIDPSYPKKPRWSSEAGRVMKDSTDQLLVLINDILDLAKTEAGHIDIALEDVALPGFLARLRKTIEGLASAGSLHVRIDVPKDLPLVRADGARLREIVLNLVDNAAKYTPTGGRIEVSVRARNDVVEVSVADTGLGIPEEVRDRIFEPFYRVDGRRPLKGQFSTGLGLALTKRLVEAQGGQIWFEGRPEGGTTFTFTLVPVSVTPLPRKGRPGRLNRTAGTPGPQGLADDRPKPVQDRAS